jgi:hypothetical protein
MTDKVIALQVQPGIQRDGTQFAAVRYVDGQWVRFQRGLPRKIGGYVGSFLNANLSRGMIMSAVNGLNYVISGYQSGVEEWTTTTNDAVGSGSTQFTMPSSAYWSANANNLWQFDIGFDSTGGGANLLVAHPGQNLSDISSSVNTRPMIAAFEQGTALTFTPVGVFTAVATFSNTSTTITLAAANGDIGAGLSISGPGIATGTTVVSVSGTTVTISTPTTSAETSVTLTFDNNISVSGGVCMLYPYLFVYGNNGLIQNCAAGDFNNWTSSDSNANNVASTKIVKGLPVRGGTTSPSGLFWSLDSLIRVSYTPTVVTTGTESLTYYWRYDLISQQSSILSSNSVIEYDGLYYWAGVDRFLMYNGVVQEIPNDTNLNYFFDNVNYVQRQKVWCTKIPRWGEIWWFYPKGNATECNDAIIYNVREKTWYDAGQAPGAYRSAGCFSEVFRFPVWAGNVANNTGNYTLWQHETGQDQIYLTNVDAIYSAFETPSIGALAGLVGSVQEPGGNNWSWLERVEPDFVQSGNMDMIVTGKGYADDTDVPSTPYTFGPSTLKIDLRQQRREMRFRFESNTQGGNYQLGKILLSIDVGDVRGTGNP